MAFGDYLQSMSKKVDQMLLRFFYNEGLFVAKHPVLVLVLTLLITTGFGVWGYFRFEEEWDPQKLYAPVNSPSSLDKDYIRKEFGYEPLTERILIIGRDHDNVLEPDILQRNLLELLEIWNLIESIELDPAPPIQLTSALESVCRNGGPRTPCKVQSVLDVWNYDKEQILADPNPLQTINSGNLTDAYGYDLDIEVILGGIEWSSKDSNDATWNQTIIGAKAFQISFQLDQNFEPYEKLIFDVMRERGMFSSDELKRLERYHEMLEDGFDPRAYAFDQDMSSALKRWGSQDNTTHLKVYISSLYEVERQSQESIRRDLIWISLSVILVGLYSNLFLFRNSWVFCKSHMVIFATISVGMAIISSFGLALGLGVKYNLVTQSVPFLLVGLGLDDAYIIIGAVNKVNGNVPFYERIAIGLSSAGSSIFVTSITDLVAFLVGILTNIPALRSFGIYASLGVLFDFFFQITFFVAALALELRRENQFTIFLQSRNSYQRPEHSHDCEMKRTRKIVGRGDFDPSQETYGMVIFGDWMPKLILSRVGQCMILIIEIIIVGFAIHGCTRVYMDFQYKEWFAPKGSQVKEAFKIEDSYFEGDQNPFVVYTKTPRTGNYFEHYDQMEDLLHGQKYENPYVAHSPKIRSWFEDYSEWLGNHSDQQTKSQQNSTSFIETLNSFLHTPKGSYYQNHILFDKNQESIKGTIFLEGYSTDLNTGQVAVDFMDNLRKVGEKTAPDLQPIAFDIMFLFYDSLRVAVAQTIKNVVLAAVAVFLLCLLTLADIGGAFLVLLMVILTDITLFGAMWYLDITFNMVTSINVILAVGIAVDYSAHITHNFLKQTGTHAIRIKQSLRYIGPEVLAGGLSTWLAAAGLIPAAHYIFKVFFEMITVIVLSGLWHGLVFLPVLLSILGPPSHRDH